MIDFLRGRVAYAEADYVVLDVRDVGYQVYTPNPYALLREEEPVQLFVHHYVREDAALLFGFPTREEQALFRKLMGVSGIGPKVALGVLASGRPEAVVAAIQQEDVGFLTRLPGIGRKTAQRMILDLKDKLGWSAGTGAAEAALGPAAAAVPAEDHSAWAAAREALAGLGYRDAELDRVWLTLKDQVGPDETPEALMKKALRQLYQG